MIEEKNFSYEGIALLRLTETITDCINSDHWGDIGPNNIIARANIDTLSVMTALLHLQEKGALNLTVFYPE
jgi:hypothetical protein